MERIEKLIVKFFDNNASFSELDELDNWIKDPVNEEIFIDLVRIKYATDYNLKTFDSNKTKKTINNLVEKERRFLKKRRIQRYYRYAAVFIVLFVLVFALQEYLSGNKGAINDGPVVIEPKVIGAQPGTDKAILTLGDGTSIALEKGKTFDEGHIISTGEQLLYDASDSEKHEFVYNYLTVPRGGQFHIKLSDGTEVWLNSESQLKYPEVFTKGQNRIVELVYGEAYFEVSPSESHNGAKFNVISQAQEVQVLGTKFNVKAYKDEINVCTTLVEGKVTVTIENVKYALEPSQKLDFNITTHSSEIKKVDVYNEISWKYGVFSFTGKPLKDIMRVVSRWYDVDVVFVTKSLETIKFKGVLGKDQNLEEIMETIKSLSELKDYSIKDKILILE